MFSGSVAADDVVDAGVCGAADEAEADAEADADMDVDGEADGPATAVFTAVVGVCPAPALPADAELAHPAAPTNTTAASQHPPAFRTRVGSMIPP